MAQVKVRFIKAHPAGIHEGKEVFMTPEGAAKVVQEEFAEYVNSEAAEMPKSEEPGITDTKKVSKPKKGKQ